MKVVNEYRYLGVTLDRHLTFKSHVANVARASGRALGSIISKMNRGARPLLATFERLVQTCVVSVMTYAIGLWGLRVNLNPIVRVLHRAQRYYLCLPRSAALSGLDVVYGWNTLWGEATVDCARVYNRMWWMSSSRLTKFLFNRRNNLVCTVLETNLLKSMKIELDEPVTREYAKLRNRNLLCLTSIHSVVWSVSLKRAWQQCLRCSKLEFLCALFVNALEATCTLRNLISRLHLQERSLISQILLGCSSLEIETGRYTQVPRDQRLCGLCKSCVGSEYHLLITCKELDCVRRDDNRLHFIACDGWSNIRTLVDHPHTFARLMKELWSVRKLMLNE